MMPQVKDDDLMVLCQTLTEQERDIIGLCLVNGRLRATKPTSDTYNGKMAQFVWRMTAFYVSPNYAHHCMPVMAEFYLPFDFNNPDRHAETRRLVKWGNDLADALTNCFDKRQWHGVIRWGQALGRL